MDTPSGHEVACHEHMLKAPGGDHKPDDVYPPSRLPGRAAQKGSKRPFSDSSDSYHMVD